MNASNWQPGRGGWNCWVCGAFTATGEIDSIESDCTRYCVQNGYAIQADDKAMDAPQAQRGTES